MTDFINFYLIPALTLGSIYALGAVGLSMIFGILRFSHFAHGDLMTIGAYGTLTAVWFIPLPPLLWRFWRRWRWTIFSTAPCASCPPSTR